MPSIIQRKQSDLPTPAMEHLANNDRQEWMIQNHAAWGYKYNNAIPGVTSVKCYSGGYIREVRYSGLHVMLFRVTRVGAGSASN